MTPTAFRSKLHLLLTHVALLLLVAGVALAHRGTARAEAPGRPGVSDGDIPDGARVSAFDHVPAVINLTPALRTALQHATRDAELSGLTLRVNSGWRSMDYQRWLMAQAVLEHGPREAKRWVASPETSHHISGEAVDIGPRVGAAWLETHGVQWGLCRVYANEPWHFELIGTSGTCPPLLLDATG